MQNQVRRDECLSAHYKHFVSLGFFCSTALELQRIGLRDTSQPFDWLITGNFERIIYIIDHHLGDAKGSILNTKMRQYEMYPSYYYDDRYEISYYHDFTEKLPFCVQLPQVEEKFRLRFQRFYKYINEATLFLRYIRSTDELNYILNHRDYIESTLRKYNSGNRIIYIANSDDITNEIDEYLGIPIFPVAKESSDSVVRMFLEKIPDLKKALLSDAIYPKQKRRQNLAFLKRKKTLSYMKKCCTRVFKKEKHDTIYRHSLIYRSEQDDLGDN